MSAVDDRASSGELTPTEQRVVELAAGRAVEQGGRRGAVRQRAHGRDPPVARLLEARRALPLPTAPEPRQPAVAVQRSRFPGFHPLARALTVGDVAEFLLEVYVATVAGADAEGLARRARAGGRGPVGRRATGALPPIDPGGGGGDLLPPVRGGGGRRRARGRGAGRAATRSDLDRGDLIVSWARCPGQKPKQPGPL